MGVEKGRDEWALVTGLKTASPPLAPGLKMKGGCIDAERLEGRWGPYEGVPCALRISMPLRSKYMWLSSGVGCGVEAVEGKVELEGE